MVTSLTLRKVLPPLMLPLTTQPPMIGTLFSVQIILTSIHSNSIFYLQGPQHHIPILLDVSSHIVRQIFWPCDKSGHKFRSDLFLLFLFLQNNNARTHNVSVVCICKENCMVSRDAKIVSMVSNSLIRVTNSQRKKRMKMTFQALSLCQSKIPNFSFSLPHLCRTAVSLETETFFVFCY